jgi:hypothetical protein
MLGIERSILAFLKENPGMSKQGIPAVADARTNNLYREEDK